MNVESLNLPGQKGKSFLCIFPRDHQWVRKYYAEPMKAQFTTQTHWQTLHAQKVWEEEKKKREEKEKKKANTSEDFQYSKVAEEEENEPF